MPVVNRCVVTVKAKQPFVDWLHALPDPVDLSLEEINDDATAYLLQDYVNESDRQEILRHFFDLIFEEELNSWWPDEDVWPEGRDLAAFHEWFAVEFHSLAIDLVDEPIEWDEEEE